MARMRVLIFFFTTFVIVSCGENELNYDEKVGCQKENSPYGVWQAKRVTSPSEKLSDGTAKSLYTIWINRNNTYKFCDGVSCTENLMKQEVSGRGGANLRGFFGDPVTKSFLELTNEEPLSTRGSYLMFDDQSCIVGRHNQYCENKQCVFFGGFDTIVFVKVEHE